MLVIRSMISHKQLLSVRRWFQKKQWSVCLLIILVFVVGCVQEDIDASLVDRSFLTKLPCTPPCWYGVKLDESNEDDVYNVLSELAFIDQTTIKKTEYALHDEKYISYSCFYLRNSHCGGIYLSQGKVVQTWHQVSYDLTFEDAVNQLGPPDYIEYVLIRKEMSTCNISLTWLEKNIVVENSSGWSWGAKECNPISQKGGVQRNIEVNTITYMTREGFLDEPGEGTRIPWPGFVEP